MVGRLSFTYYPMVYAESYCRNKMKNKSRHEKKDDRTFVAAVKMYAESQLSKSIHQYTMG